MHAIQLNVPTDPVISSVVRVVLFNVNDGVALPLTCILKSLFDVLQISRPL